MASPIHPKNEAPVRVDMHRLVGSLGLGSEGVKELDNGQRADMRFGANWATWRQQKNPEALPSKLSPASNGGEIDVNSTERAGSLGQPTRDEHVPRTRSRPT